jgi:hypothetical protein
MVLRALGGTYRKPEYTLEAFICYTYLQIGQVPPMCVQHMLGSVSILLLAVMSPFRGINMVDQKAFQDYYPGELSHC